MPVKKPHPLSIAIITHRRPQHLQRCLDSLRQHAHYLDIIIIDNSHIPTSKIIIKHFPDLNIHFYHLSQPNRSNARNLAIKKCSTNYLAFIDDDCIITPLWSKNILKFITKYPQHAYFQGQSISTQTHNLLVKSFQKTRNQWLKTPYAIDTRNLILNLNIIRQKPIKFDPQFQHFEDVDFGLQIKKHQLSGLFTPRICVIHPETTSLHQLINKSYLRGQWRYYLDKKWQIIQSLNNTPQSYLNLFKNLFKPSILIQQIINIYFNKGYLRQVTIDQTPIALINQSDKSANEERQFQVFRFLNSHHQATVLIDSQKLFNQKINSLKNFYLSPIIFTSYRLLRFLTYKLNLKYLLSYLLYFEIKLRGVFIHQILRQQKISIAISQCSLDFCCAIKPRKTKIILDLPTIFSQEIKFSHQYPSLIVHKIEKLERTAYKQAEFTSFHWQNLLEFSQKINKYPKNPFVLNWGCQATNHVCHYSPNPKIIYLGNLNSDWINQKLLLKFISKSPFTVDIYGYEAPKNPQLKKYYHGYLNNLDKLAEYQYGLITHTDDPLRNHGFSAKHLLYFSYGLPVLLPTHRLDPVLKSATININSLDNLSSQLSSINHLQKWNQFHQQAINIATQNQWSKNLLPILTIINTLKSS